MAFRLLLPQKLLKEMVAQALAEQPLECCGLLAGVREEAKKGDDPAKSVGRVVRRYPLVNELASPREFLSDARGMFDADRDMRARGLDILAVYHSHPTSAPIPSRTDRERHWMHDVICMIVSLAASPPEVRAWWVNEEEQREAEWEITEP
jgi:proteasome lid subunit RPN8/RPN11